MLLALVELLIDFLATSAITRGIRNVASHLQISIPHRSLAKLISIPTIAPIELPFLRP